MRDIPTLIYCASGNRRFAEIALFHNFRYGAQLPNTVYFSPYFADQNWKSPQRGPYMKALKEHRPARATVLDFEREDQREEVLSWADEAAQWADGVIVIPKVMGVNKTLPRIIRGKPVILGYSVPTRYGGTSVPMWEFRDWPVHLLGGSPQEQMKLSRYLNVVSADGNYILGMATRYNQFFVPGTARTARNRWWPQLRETVFGEIEDNAPYWAFELSCMNIQAAWTGCTAMIRFAQIADIPTIKRIGYMFRNELGFVHSKALEEAIQRLEVYVAVLQDAIVGFVHWHRRRDGWSTIYEIAVRPSHQCRGIGRGLLATIPKPYRLKCTVDNPANEFYARIGLERTRRERGRNRELYVWTSD